MFIPPFCPKKHCRHHDRSHHVLKWYTLAGFHTTKAFGKVQRYRCKSCHATCSEQTFNLDYFTKKAIDYRSLMIFLSNSMSIRAISRFYKASTGTISNRTERLSHQLIASHWILSKGMTLREDLVADGFEAFTVSQYFPENITILVGKDSQFLYSFRHMTIRRKGRMTRKQKIRRDMLNRKVAFTSNGIKKSFQSLLEALLKLWNPSCHSPLTLVTDEKTEYKSAIRSFPQLQEMMKGGLFHHVTINSRATRNRQNPLFPVNYMDREMRKDIAAYRRETVCFGRNVSAGMARMSIFAFYHNFYKPYRIRNDSQYSDTHASVAGIADAGKIKGIEQDLFRNRQFMSHLGLNEYESDIWLKRLLTPLKKSPEYVPAFYAA
jgi:transposase-like protein